MRESLESLPRCHACLTGRCNAHHLHSPTRNSQHESIFLNTRDKTTSQRRVGQQRPAPGRRVREHWRLVQSLSCLRIQEVKMVTEERGMERMSLSSRGDFPELAVCLVRDDIQRAVRPLSHVAHPLPAVGEQVLLASDPVVFEGEADQPFVLEAAGEEAPRATPERRSPCRTGRRTARSLDPSNRPAARSRDERSLPQGSAVPSIPHRTPRAASRSSCP